MTVDVDDLLARDLHLERLRRLAAERCERLESELRDARLILAALDGESARNSLTITRRRSEQTTEGRASGSKTKAGRGETSPAESPGARPPGGALTKRCYRCGEEKPLEDFYASRAMADGRQTKCKPCDNAMRTSKARRANGAGKGRSACRLCAGLPHRVTGETCRGCGLAFVEERRA